MVPADPDLEVLERIKHGDEEGLPELMSRHRGKPLPGIPPPM
ncbi:MAG: hypothetical protein PF795_04040 [Kiritimatiellae bacterium]|nr:hypothetical protein [Kiritimatiellia bacterium]